MFLYLVLLAVSYAKQLIISHKHVSDIRFLAGCIGAFQFVLGDVSVGVHATSNIISRH